MVLLTNISREYESASQFLCASDFMLDLVRDDHGDALAEFTSSFIVAVAAFGTCERHARIAERTGLLKCADARGKAAAEESARQNAKGLVALGYARRGLDAYRQQIPNLPTKAVPAADFESFLNDLRFALVDLDAKTSDTEKMYRAVSENLEQLRKGGAAALGNYLDTNLANLEKLRRQNDRGAVDNIPVWKVAAIAVAVGVWVWALFRCRWWGSCSRKEGLAYAVVIWLAGLIARFC